MSQNALISSRTKLLRQIQLIPQIADRISALEGCDDDIEHRKKEEKSMIQFIVDSVHCSVSDLRSILVTELVEIHPSDFCNLRCEDCAYNHDIEGESIESSSFDRNFFPIESISSMIDILRPRACTISGGGEPGLYKPTLGRFVSEIHHHSKEIECGLITNGTISSSFEAKWVNSLKWIRVSLDAGNEKIYRLFKKSTRDSFENVLRNVLFLLEKTTCSVISIGYSFSDVNIESVIDLLKWIECNIAPPLFFSRLKIQFRPWKRRNELDIRTPSMSESTLRNLRRSLKKYFKDAATRSNMDLIMQNFLRKRTNWDEVMKDEENKQGGMLERFEQKLSFDYCYSSLSKIIVRSNGDMYPCCVQQEKPLFYLGNLMSSSIDYLVLRRIFVFLFSVTKICVPKPYYCLKMFQNHEWTLVVHQANCSMDESKSNVRHLDDSWQDDDPKHNN